MANSRIMQLLPVLLGYFIMSGADLVGIGSNYIKADLGLTDSQTGLFASMLFFWFLVFPVPFSMVMNRIGRKKTVLLSIAITFIAVLPPLFGASFGIMLFSFALLGIGNAIMQTSLNPLVSNVVSPGRLSSTLTLGQAMKTFAASLGPFIAMWGALYAGEIFHLGWRFIFLLYAFVSLGGMLWLWATPIVEESPDKASGFRECLVLLKHGFVFLSFLGIICHVGIDVGLITTVPRILMERCQVSLADASFGISMYFVCRIIGSLFGAAFLSKIPPKTFFLVSAVLICVGLAGLVFAEGQTALYICIIMCGLGNSNIFAIIFSQAILRIPDEANEISGLMIMGVFGGAIFPPIMGFVSDVLATQIGAIVVMGAGAIYFLFYSVLIRARSA